MTGLWRVLGGSDVPFDEMIKLDYRFVAGLVTENRPGAHRPDDSCGFPRTTGVLRSQSRSPERLIDASSRGLRLANATVVDRAAGRAGADLEYFAIRMSSPTLGGTSRFD